MGNVSFKDTHFSYSYMMSEKVTGQEVFHLMTLILVTVI